MIKRILRNLKDRIETRAQEIKEREELRVQGDVYKAALDYDFYSKHESSSVSVPVAFIDLDKILEELAEISHPAIMEISKPTSPEDFDVLEEDLAEVFSDYFNNQIKAVIMSAIRLSLQKDLIEIVVSDDEMDYVVKDEDEERSLDQLVTLERRFRNIGV